MTQKQAEGNVDALSQESTELKAPSLEDFMSPAPKEEAEAEPEEVEESGETEGQDETEDEAPEQAESEEESEEGEVLSHEIDIEQIPAEERSEYLDTLYESLDDEARREWLSSRQGRVGTDMGKMRKEKSEAVERAEAAEAKYQALQNKSFEPNNPFASITDPDALDTKAQEIDANISAARKFLRGNEDYITVQGEEVDRETVDGWLDKYLEQKDAIPKQKDRIRSIKQATEKAKEVEAKLADTYPWLQEQSGEKYEAYKKLRTDPNWAMVADLIPELASELPKVLAKYVSDGESAPAKSKKSLPTRGKRKAKSDFGGGAAGQRKPKDTRKAATKNLFDGSATSSDVLAMFS